MKESAPVVDLSQATRLVEEMRSKGGTVVMANGAFDPIHAGHVCYLRDARQMGEFLVVAVNDDDSVRRLKGPGRPAVPASERVAILAAQRFVDVVVLFAQDTVVDILNALKPDIHAKGPDYTAETVPERDVVAAYGGRTVITSGSKDISSSDFLKRLRRP